MSDSNIINRNILPDLLSDEGFIYYFNKFKDGSSDALDILAMHNLKLVYWYIDSNIKCDGEEYKEIFSVGCEALVEAFYKFELNRDVKFSTFATSCIRNKILKYFRSKAKHKNTLSLDVPICDSDNGDTFADILMDDSVGLEENLLEKDLIDFRKRIIKDELMFLNDIDRTIIEMYFGFKDGKTYSQSDIAKLLGFSQSRISKRLSSTLKILKARIELIEQEKDDKRITLARKIA